MWYLKGDWLYWRSPSQLFFWQRHLQGVKGVNIFLFITPFALKRYSGGTIVQCSYHTVLLEYFDIHIFTFFKAPCPKKVINLVIFALIPSLSFFCVFSHSTECFYTLFLKNTLGPVRVQPIIWPVLIVLPAKEGSLCVHPPPNLLPTHQAHYANLIVIVHFTQPRQLIKQ